MTREAVIVSAVRSAIARRGRGNFRETHPIHYGGLVVKEAVARAKGLDPMDIDDLIIGCAMPEGELGMNLARLVAFAAGLPYQSSAVTVNRFCASGLQSISQAAERIMLGEADVVVAGGVEDMTHVPMGGNKPVAYPQLVDKWVEAYSPMGLTAENVARRHNITRERQDQFALRSHQRALKAIDEGRFKSQILPIETEVFSAGPDGRPVAKKVVLDTDEGPRRETTLEGLAKLKPAFDPTGTVTAGNSSQMNDGAAAVVVMSAEKAKALKLKPLAIYRHYQVAGVPPEVMGEGPAFAIPKLLKRAGLKTSDIDVYEVNEAFASQAIYCCEDVLHLDMDKVNPNGGAIALGHPLGCTGSFLTNKLLYELERTNGRYGVVSMCIGGGMGAAGLFERVK
ncbi:MAG TPA: thiolase family protein [Myxococcota bacterium]|nr:thiolase family protein [Myxococcota bacterium]HRY94756.1 thiolase family protein [Myxococcota bacterium]HSA20833.1 thiolase family protein [Myxococcota bacterium]